MPQEAKEAFGKEEAKEKAAVDRHGSTWKRLKKIKDDPFIQYIRTGGPRNR